jgi:hypothetical protein
MSILSLSLQDDGTATIEASDGASGILHCSRAFFSGSTLRGFAPEETALYEVKVRSCKRTDGDAERPFRIEGRFVNLSRAQRERICGADA